MSTDTKTCTQCKISKPATREFFSPDSRCAQPFQSRCKACTRENSAKKLRAKGVPSRSEALAAQMLPEKTCTKCKVSKPNTTEFFYVNQWNKAILATMCAECHKSAHRTPEVHARVNEANKTPERLAVRRKNMAAYYRRSKLKCRARQALCRAVEQGKVVRQPCACGATDTEGHHHNGYEKAHWLDVEWLCRECHRKEHVVARVTRHPDAPPLAVA